MDIEFVNEFLSVQRKTVEELVSKTLVLETQKNLTESKLLKASTRIEELEKEYNQEPEEHMKDWFLGQIEALKQILSQSTPLIPEIEKAMDVAREIKDDSAHDTFTAEDISGCTEVCTYGWRYKTTNENYISNFKLDI